MEIQKSLSTGLRLHLSGQLGEAEVIYRQILSQDPRHADALHLLGVIAYQTGRHQTAVGLIRQAIDINPNSSQYYSNLGLALTDLGETADAVAALREALRLDRNAAAAHNNLGNALMRLGQFQDAIASYRAAVQLQADYADAYSGLGDALREKGELQAATDALRTAIRLNPNLAAAHNNLGAVLVKQCLLDAAADAFRLAVRLDPASVPFRTNLANAMQNQGHLQAAIEIHRGALQLEPKNAEVYFNLGMCLKDTDRFDEAIDCFKVATGLKPNYANAFNSLGACLFQTGDLEGALVACRGAIAAQADFSEAYNNLGNVFSEANQFEQAEDAFRQSLTLKPQSPAPYGNLGSLLKLTGRIPEALAAYSRAIELAPRNAAAHSDFLYTLHFSTTFSAAQIHDEHVEWGLQHARPLEAFIRPHNHDRTPDRPLRIGYVSADFRRHSVAFFLLPLLRARDSSQFHVTCYHTSARRDRITAEIHSACDVFRPLLESSDEAAAEIIRSDKIDILVDLNGHTAQNRLLVFARKPAPIQVAYLGYPNTTGMAAIDWRLTDSIADPAGSDALYSEKLWRLPGHAWCFHPLSGSPPSERSGHDGITFGSFNDLAKINEPMLRCWADILKQVEGSKLALKNRAMASPSVRARVTEALESLGVEQNRIILMPPQPMAEDHLRSYCHVDISLDTYPYHGTTTTCEALWMGVPVVTRRGASHVSRVGASLLSAVGLPELIAGDNAEYIRIALELGRDASRLHQLRATLRQRMLASPLMNASRLAGEIEAAYRRMWLTWLAQA